MGVLANPRHERFAQELARGRTATEAYVRAGFKANEGNAGRLNRNEQVEARVREILSAAAVRTEITMAQVIAELGKIGFANMQDYMRVGEDGDPYTDFSTMDRDQAAAIVELTVEDFKDGRGDDAREVRRIKFKLGDKRAALVDIGKALGGFTTKVEHSGTIGAGITDVDEARATIARLMARRNEQDGQTLQ